MERRTVWRHKFQKIWAMESRGEKAYLVLLAREVVRALNGALNALLQAAVAAVVGTEDAVLEATGIFELELQLAELAALGGWDVGARLHGILVEGQGNCGAVIRKKTLHGVVGAASATVGHGLDGDVMAGRGVLWCRCREGKGKGCEQEESGALHCDDGMEKSCRVVEIEVKICCCLFSEDDISVVFYT